MIILMRKEWMGHVACTEAKKLIQNFDWKASVEENT
jgi:hypothetical protein